MAKPRKKSECGWYWVRRKGSKYWHPLQLTTCCGGLGAFVSELKLELGCPPHSTSVIPLSMLDRSYVWGPRIIDPPKVVLP